MKQPRFLRKDLARFIPDPRTIKELEDLAFAITDELPVELGEIETAIGSVQELVSALIGMNAQRQREIDLLRSLIAAQPIPQDYERRLRALETAFSTVI